MTNRDDLTPRTPGSSQDESHLEEAVQDDEIIGVAFRWSLVVIVVLVCLGLLVWLVLSLGDSTEEVVIQKEVAAPEALVPNLAVLPDVPFTDVTSGAGIEFRHQSGAEGDKLLPETMGSGVAFFDFDGDEDQDLLLVNAARWDHSSLAGEPSPPALYRNDGTGSFEDVSADSGFVDTFYGTGVAVGDIDGDGRRDVFIAAVGPNRLYRNTLDGFVDITDSAGVAGAAGEWGSSPAMLDYDRDGDLDLFVPNYVSWSRDKDLALNFTLNGTDRAYGPPKQYEGSQPRLYRNRGDGTFEDVSEASGMHVVNLATGVPVGKSLAVVPIDLDEDGWMDLVVANDTTQNFLYRNRGDGTFEEIGTLVGVAYDDRGQATGAMGIDAAYYRNDDSIGIGIGNFANEMTSFYVGEGDLFSDEAILEGIGSPTRPLLSFGLFFFDYDLDGRLDLFQTNGHLEEEINEIQSSQQYRQPAQLFWNAGPDQPACFEIVPSETAGDLVVPIVGRGAAYADIDADGDLDVLVTQAGDRPLLLRNEQTLGHHWLRIRLDDPTSINRDAIGAWIDLSAGGIIQRRQVMPTRSYLSQVELPVTFGLGELKAVDSLSVTWPDGSVETFPVGSLLIDQAHVVQRGQGTPGR
ncbi:MAG: CRTAC1 family protein [Planctomycetota bacterium]|nr:CRTAC1 family protein [Planctomycetota bacterium]